MPYKSMLLLYFFMIKKNKRSLNLLIFSPISILIMNVVNRPPRIPITWNLFLSKSWDGKSDGCHFHDQVMLYGHSHGSYSTYITIFLADMLEGVPFTTLEGAGCHKLNAHVGEAHVSRNCEGPLGAEGTLQQEAKSSVLQVSRK